MKVINKIAFLVHDPMMYVHYSSVWSAMDQDSFVIVLLGIFLNRGNGNFGVKDFLNKVQLSGYEIVYLDEIVAKSIKYQYAVSNHIMAGSSRRQSAINTMKMFLNATVGAAGFSKKYEIQHIDPVQYLPLQVGIKQVRFMYGADISDAWSLDEWNEIYDLFLCHGPNDEMHLKKRFKGKTAIMGYPRYDGYFSPDLNVNELYAEFNIDRNKQTILWMPTYDSFNNNVCSIPFFAKSISSLSSEFNIIVRPHPLSFRLDPTGIALLKSLNFKIDSDPTRDMNKSFRLSDFILCDYGGSAFGALYLGKKLVLLNTPTKSDASFVKGSSNLALLDYFPRIDVDQVNDLRLLLKDTAYWNECLEKSRSIVNKYFADYRGNSSIKTVEIFDQLDSIISKV